MSYKFTVVKRGYDQSEVDNYIESLERQIEEYKEKSASINKALINAQFTADNIIKNAHTETEKILSNAENMAYDMKQKTISQINLLKNKIISQRRMIENFQNEYNFLVEKYLKPVNDKEINPLIESLDEFDNLIDDLVALRYDKSKPLVSEEQFLNETNDNQKNNNNDNIVTYDMNMQENNTKDLKDSNIKNFEPKLESNSEYNLSSEISPAEALYFQSPSESSKAPIKENDNIISKLEYEELSELFPSKYKSNKSSKFK